MKYIPLILHVFFVLLLQNCGDKDYADTLEGTTTIEIQKDFLLGEASELQFEILDTINLEAPGNPPITAIQDIAFSKDFFLLVDIKQGLLKFDNSGGYLRTIGELGEGPEEYTVPYAIHLDEKGKIVLVADWQKREVISYDLEGNVNSSSERLPGHPISFYMENDTVLVVQESLVGTKEKPSQVLLSAIEPNTLAVKHRESPLYGYNSNFTIFHSIPRILSRVKGESLFYLPIIRGDIKSHTDTDTIYRKEEDRLVPEYLLCFTGFDNSHQLRIGQMVMSDRYVFLRVIYENQSHYLVIDLENKRPLLPFNQLFNHTVTEGIMPRPFEEDVFYSILRDEEGFEEKNPLIVLFRIISEG
ncbi:6-bladed beta-propeller [Pleomorphovibrio marinus]|uniref:6-bladed beta-propeller n=1 Tax=Pleomorphovibrio marinus TaxID=2164132 RepID=UPI000E0AB337|nr:6-bladed beta-propeller [Pleomorphovibrio marinus]